jgi:hypothetical protein
MPHGGGHCMTNLLSSAVIIVCNILGDPIIAAHSQLCQLTCCLHVCKTTLQTSLCAHIAACSTCAGAHTGNIPYALELAFTALEGGQLHCSKRSLSSCSKHALQQDNAPGTIPLPYYYSAVHQAELSSISTIDGHTASRRVCHLPGAVHHPSRQKTQHGTALGTHVLKHD